MQQPRTSYKNCYVCFFAGSKGRSESTTILELTGLLGRVCNSSGLGGGLRCRCTRRKRAFGANCKHMQHTISVRSRFPFGLEPLHVRANNNLGALSREATQACTQDRGHRFRLEGAGSILSLTFYPLKWVRTRNSPFCAEKANSRLSGPGTLSDKLSVACCCWGSNKGLHVCARHSSKRRKKQRESPTCTPVRTWWFLYDVSESQCTPGVPETYNTPLKNCTLSLR